MKTKKFNYFDEALFLEVKRDFSMLKSKASQFAKELKKYGYTVSLEAISDCFTAKEEQEQGESLDDFSHSFGTDKAMVRHAIRSVFRGVEHISKDLRRKLQASAKQAISPSEKQEREERISTEFADMIREIIRIRSYRDTSSDVPLFLSAIDVKGDEVVFKADAEAVIKEKATVYCTTENAVKAMEAHSKAVDALNELASFIKDGAMADDFNSLFELNGNQVVRSNVNYNLFVK